MFVVPMMIGKGLHWGNTRFYLGYLFKPVNYIDVGTIRHYHKEGYVPIVPKQEVEKIEQQDEVEEDKEEGGIAACPIAPVLWLFGLHKAKKPANHAKLVEMKSQEEALRTVKMALNHQ